MSAGAGASRVHHTYRKGDEVSILAQKWGKEYCSCTGPRVYVCSPNSGGVCFAKHCQDVPAPRKHEDRMVIVENMDTHKRKAKQLVNKGKKGKN